jgi:hypothetical protein
MSTISYEIIKKQIEQSEYKCFKFIKKINELKSIRGRSYEEEIKLQNLKSSLKLHKNILNNNLKLIGYKIKK